MMALLYIIPFLCISFLVYVYKEIKAYSSREDKLKDRKEKEDLKFIDKAKEIEKKIEQQIKRVEQNSRPQLFEQTYHRINGIEEGDKVAEEKKGDIVFKQDQDVEEPQHPQHSQKPQEMLHTMDFQNLKSSVHKSLDLIRRKRTEAALNNI